jgi:hypothetical protein
VLQWVDNTIAMSAYLVGAQSEHERYRPCDWSHGKCRKTMAEAHKGVAEAKMPPSGRFQASPFPVPVPPNNLTHALTGSGLQSGC